MKYVWDIYMHHAIYCDRLRPCRLCPYMRHPANYNYLRTHCAQHNFIYYAINDIFIYIKITKRKQYSNVFFLVLKHLHTYIMIKILYFLFMRKNINRKYISPTKNKVQSCLAFSKIKKNRWDKSYFSCLLHVL